MSVAPFHRVGFLTYNISEGSPELSTGCNGFPFVTPEWPGSDPGGGHPVHLSYAQAIKWWWRVRTWIVANDLSITDGDNTYSWADITTLTESHAAIAECELAGINAGGPGISRSFGAAGSIEPDQDFGFGGGWGVQASINALIMPGTLCYRDFATPGIWPALVVEGLITAYNDSSPFSPFGLGRFYSVFYEGSTGSIGATVDALDLTVYTSAYDVPESPAGPFTFGGSTLTFSPNSYWPYANTNGDPIYDETTGSVINSPWP